MKFTFKIQQYQTDAVDAVVRVFQGQPYRSSMSYIRDVGTLPGLSGQINLLPGMDDNTQSELEDVMNEIGFKNEALQLSDAQLLQNICSVQSENNLRLSDSLTAPLGRVSLDVEM